MEKRRFFGLSLVSPWPDPYPDGRVIAPEGRHVTLAFLGHEKPPSLDECPLPSFELAPVGIFNELLFLNHVVAYHLNCFTDVEPFAKELQEWLGLDDPRPFLPHATVARQPFTKELWKPTFSPLPFVATGFHLYESEENLSYTQVWSHRFEPPIQELPHTADLAFLVKGESLQGVYESAAIALFMEFPEMTPFFERVEVKSHRDVVRALNHIVAECDAAVGCPIKAASHHGRWNDNEWEMIIDV